MPAVPAEAAAMAVSSASAHANGPHLGVGGPEGDELGGPLGEVDHGRPELSPDTGRTATPGAGPGRR